MQAQFSALAASLGGENAHFAFFYDESLSHLIYAACDIIAVPSMFEPCGLTQVQVQAQIYSGSDSPAPEAEMRNFAIFHDETLAHFMYAGCDFIAEPSVSEPCKLTQANSHACNSNAAVLYQV